ncbi:MAG: LCP family protein, partial [Patescibacteria group bacterium]
MWQTIQNIYNTWPSLLKRWWWLCLVLALAGSIVVTIVIKGQLVGEINHSNQTSELEVVSLTPLPPIDENTKQVGVLLAGYGGPGHSGGMLADVIQVLWVDIENSQVALISIPRDLWISTTDGGTKINAGLTNSSGLETGMQAMKQLASTVIGLPINYAVTVDFVGFQRLVGETLDGIEVDVAATLEDTWYPITGEELNTCGLTAQEVG